MLFRSATENLPRNTVEECYSLINKDIDEAIELLEDYTPESVSHFSPIVALGLKSRICLAQQDYAGAASAALKAIEMAAKKGYRLMEGDELYNGFADISTTTKEALWASLTLSDQTVNYYSYMALISWNFNSEPVRIGVKQISQSLYDKIADTDLRKDWWDETGSLPLPKETYVATPYSNRKFTARSTDNPVSNVSFMRLAELYLVYSEAAVRNNDLDTGKKIFAEFMATRDPQYQVPASQDQLLEDIMISRRVELWGVGFRFYDLKPLNLSLNSDGTNFNAGFCIILKALASDPRWNWAIPQAEMDANPNMVQNQY